MKRFRGVNAAPVLLAGLLLTGCAASSTATSGSPASPPPSTGSPTTSAGSPAAPPDPASASGKGRLVTVTGTVRTGVEQGCLVLSTPQGVYTLLGNGRTTLRAGTRVEVQGRTDETRFTTCQQGPVLLVSSARVLG